MSGAQWGLMLPRIVELGVVAVGAWAWGRIPVHFQFEQEVDSDSAIFYEVRRYHSARLERPSLVTDWITDEIWVRRRTLKLLRRRAEAVHRATKREASIVLDSARKRLAHLGHCGIPLRGQGGVGEPACVVRMSAAYDGIVESVLLAWIRSQFGVFDCDALVDCVPAVHVHTVIHVPPSSLFDDASDARLHHAVIAWTWTWLLRPHHAPREVLRFLPHRVLRRGLGVTIILGRNPTHECLMLAWFWGHFLIQEDRVNVKFGHPVSWLSEVALALHQGVSLMERLRCLC